MQSQPQPQLAAMLRGQMFEGFLLVKAAEQRTSSNGGKYLDMTLADRSGEVNAKMWDGAAAAPKALSVVKVRGMMLEYNNRAQLRVDKMRLPEEKDPVDMNLLIPCAPEPPEVMRERCTAGPGRFRTRACANWCWPGWTPPGIGSTTTPPLRSCTTPSAAGFCTTPAPCFGPPPPFAPSIRTWMPTCWPPG